MLDKSISLNRYLIQGGWSIPIVTLTNRKYWDHWLLHSSIGVNQVYNMGERNGSWTKLHIDTFSFDNVSNCSLGNLSIFSIGWSSRLWTPGENWGKCRLTHSSPWDSTMFLCILEHPKQQSYFNFTFWTITLQQKFNKF